MSKIILALTILTLTISAYARQPTGENIGCPSADVQYMCCPAACQVGFTTNNWKLADQVLHECAIEQISNECKSPNQMCPSYPSYKCYDDSKITTKQLCGDPTICKIEK